jgi:hypothetical protein
MTMDHVQYYAKTIGPRGSATEKEAEAAQYSAQVLSRAGLEAFVEPYQGARSAYYPFALFSGMFVLAEFLFIFLGRTGAIAAALVTVFALVSVLLELFFKPNPFRWVLPKGKSHNAWARVPAEGPVKHKVVVVGHIDSHRTPLLFSTPGWTKFFKTLIPLGLGSSVILILFYIIGAFYPSSALIWASIPFSLVLLAVFLMTLQADFTPYTEGANDNATGAAITLSTAESLARQPLKNTEVWALLSGCEEVGLYGAEAFAHTHKDELKGAFWIALDSLGSGQVVYLTVETFLAPAKSDPELLEIARQVSERCPELDAAPHAFQGAYTEGFIGVKHGFKTLTMMGMNRSGELPEWHRPTDDMDHLDPKVVDRAEKFLLEIMREIDRKE